MNIMVYMKKASNYHVESIEACNITIKKAQAHLYIKGVDNIDVEFDLHGDNVYKVTRDDNIYMKLQGNNFVDGNGKVLKMKGFI